MSLGKLRQTGHQFEALGADGLQLAQVRVVLLTPGESKIGEGDGVEVIVSEGDKTKALAPQLYDLFDDRVGGSLAWAFARRCARPSRKSNAWDSRGPSALKPTYNSCGESGPTRGRELVSINAAAFVNRFGRAAQTVGQDLGPNDVAVAFHYSMGTA